MSTSHTWLKEPLIISAPMRFTSGPALAIAVSRAGGLGFLGIGEDTPRLATWLQETQAIINNEPIPGVPKYCLPIGVGFINWGANLDTICREFSNLEKVPYAIWLFAPKSLDELAMWVQRIKAATKNRSLVWVQVGTVAAALETVRETMADGLIVQGSDAGGHGLVQSASLMTLLPEVRAALDDAGFESVKLSAAGGIMNGKGAAAAKILGANSIVMGTRFLASTEAQVMQGYKNAVLDAKDGGLSTVRTTLYDNLRGTTGWPSEYNGRGVTNKSFRDWKEGMPDQENKRMYTEAMKLGDAGWGAECGRITTYAGTGVGLVKNILSAGEIVEEVRKDIGVQIQMHHNILNKSGM